MPFALRYLQVDRRGLSLLSALELVADPLPLMQASKTCPLNGGDMNEDVLRAILGLNEAEALRGVEPLTVPMDICPSS